MEHTTLYVSGHRRAHVTRTYVARPVSEVWFVRPNVTLRTVRSVLIQTSLAH